ncbi:MAG: hypothetical protein U0531_18970 [Dehalococcoidia bacterium]
MPSADRIAGRDTSLDRGDGTHAHAYRDADRDASPRPRRRVVRPRRRAGDPDGSAHTRAHAGPAPPPPARCSSRMTSRTRAPLFPLRSPSSDARFETSYVDGAYAIRNLTRDTIQFVEATGSVRW